MDIVPSMDTGTCIKTVGWKRFSLAKTKTKISIALPGQQAGALQLWGICWDESGGFQCATNAEYNRVGPLCLNTIPKCLTGVLVRLVHTEGKEKIDEMYNGGTMIFVDHALGMSTLRIKFWCVQVRPLAPRQHSSNCLQPSVEYMWNTIAQTIIRFVRRSSKLSYPRIIGMLKYLQACTGSDVTFAVSQCARFIRSTRCSHELALNRNG